MTVIRSAGPDGAALAGATRPALGQVSSTIARRLARAGLVTIDAGAHAHLT